MERDDGQFLVAGTDAAKRCGSAVRALALVAAMLIVLAAAAAGCARVTVDPIEVKPVPIHIVHDVNIRVDRQLEDFFAFEDRVAATQPAATQPAATTAPTTPTESAAPAAADAQ